MPAELETPMTLEQAADALGVSARTLVRIVRAKGYAFTNLTPESRPGGGGYVKWRFTSAQLAAIVEGQQVRFVPPPQADAATPPPRAASQKFALPGGRSRLARKRPPERG